MTEDEFLQNLDTTHIPAVILIYDDGTSRITHDFADRNNLVRSLRVIADSIEMGAVYKHRKAMEN
jgi:hypothetical protein